VRPSLLALLLLFAPMSFASVGGGQTLVAGIHQHVVTDYHWLTEGQFVDTFAISRMSPGPGSLLVTLIGWQTTGWLGAVVASFAIFAPTSFLVYGLARVWSRHKGARWQVALEAGLRPIAAGMILASGLVLIEALEGGWLARAIAVAATVVLLFTRVNALVLLGAGAVLFTALHGILPA
jgi:chromate transporter